MSNQQTRNGKSTDTNIWPPSSKGTPQNEWLADSEGTPLKGFLKGAKQTPQPGWPADASDKGAAAKGWTPVDGQSSRVDHTEKARLLNKDKPGREASPPEGSLYPGTGGAWGAGGDKGSSDGEKEIAPSTKDQVGSPHDVLKCSNGQTLMNLIKGTVGTGILSLPLAFKNAGLWVGFVCFLFISLAAVHCMHRISVITGILERKSGQELRSYVDTVEYSVKFGPSRLRGYSDIARAGSILLLYGMHFGFVLVYIVWIATNVKPVFDTFWSGSPDVRVYSLMVYLCLLPMVMIRSLRTLAAFSALANVCYVLGLVVIFQYILKDIPDASDRPAFASWSTMPMFFGTALFAYESVTLIVPLRSRALHQEDFGGWTGVLTLGTTIIVVVYCAVGFYGYLKFGEDVAPAITLNLPQDEWLYLNVNLVFSLAMYISVAVQLYVPINVIWPALEPEVARVTRHTRLAEMALRAGILLLLTVLGIVVPHIDLLMALVGSVCGSFLCLVIPMLVDLLTLHEESRLTIPVLAKDLVILLVGLCGFLTGTYSSLLNIAQSF